MLWSGNERCARHQDCGPIGLPCPETYLSTVFIWLKQPRPDIFVVLDVIWYQRRKHVFRQVHSMKVHEILLMVGLGTENQTRSSFRRPLSAYIGECR